MISGLPTESSSEQKVFHAGTAFSNKEQDGPDGSKEVVTNGGRVLCATALGNTVLEAQQKAVALAKQISWDGVFTRSDIGYRAIAREQGKS